MGNYINSYLHEKLDNKIQLIHVTTPEIAKQIKIEGFISRGYINHKYYSNLGNNGIYFYDNRRQAQFYAGHLMSKINSKKVALIFCEILRGYTIYNSKIEDGIFIKTEDLPKIKINGVTIESYSEIY